MKKRYQSVPALMPFPKQEVLEASTQIVGKRTLSASDVVALNGHVGIPKTNFIYPDDDYLSTDQELRKSRFHEIPFNRKTAVTLRTHNFFNGNYIPSYFKTLPGEQRYFIATQAPKNNTIADFWEVVFEKDVKNIVMCTNIDRFIGESSCVEYYPSRVGESMSTGYSKVVCTSESKDGPEIRTLQVERGDVVKKLKHFKFSSWTDRTWDVSPRELNKVYSELGGQSTPKGTLVHCTAGLSRTCAFILYHQARCSFEKMGVFDPFEYVNTIRKSRFMALRMENQAEHLLLAAAQQEMMPRRSVVPTYPDIS